MRRSFYQSSEADLAMLLYKGIKQLLTEKITKKHGMNMNIAGRLNVIRHNTNYQERKLASASNPEMYRT